MFLLKHQYVQTCSLKEKNRMLLLILLTILLLCIIVNYVWIIIQWFMKFLHHQDKTEILYVVQNDWLFITWYLCKCLTINHHMQHIIWSLHCSMQELQKLLYTRRITYMCTTILHCDSFVHHFTKISLKYVFINQFHQTLWLPNISAIQYTNKNIFSFNIFT